LKTLEIKRWKNEIIFLYKVVDGISEGSFGIHVAKLAGLKENLIERSREILSSPSDVNEKNFELDFDVDDSQIESKEKNEDIINFIKDLNVDEISPKDALDILYTLKKNFID
jgi:DNA mismatch repair protein MutS